MNIKSMFSLNICCTIIDEILIQVSRGLNKHKQNQAIYKQSTLQANKYFHQIHQINVLDHKHKSISCDKNIYSQKQPSIFSQIKAKIQYRQQVIDCTIKKSKSCILTSKRLIPLKTNNASSTSLKNLQLQQKKIHKSLAKYNARQTKNKIQLEKKRFIKIDDYLQNNQSKIVNTNLINQEDEKQNKLRKILIQNQQSKKSNLHKHSNVYGTNPNLGDTNFISAMLSCLHHICYQKANPNQDFYILDNVEVLQGRPLDQQHHNIISKENIVKINDQNEVKVRNQIQNNFTLNKFKTNRQRNIQKQNKQFFQLYHSNPNRPQLLVQTNKNMIRQISSKIEQPRYLHKSQQKVQKKIQNQKLSRIIISEQKRRQISQQKTQIIKNKNNSIQKSITILGARQRRSLSIISNEVNLKKKKNIKLPQVKNNLKLNLSNNQKVNLTQNQKLDLTNNQKVNLTKNIKTKQNNNLNVNFITPKQTAIKESFKNEIRKETQIVHVVNSQQLEYLLSKQVQIFPNKQLNPYNNNKNIKKDQVDQNQKKTIDAQHLNQSIRVSISTQFIEEAEWKKAQRIVKKQPRSSKFHYITMQSNSRNKQNRVHSLKNNTNIKDNIKMQTEIHLYGHQNQNFLPTDSSCTQNFYKKCQENYTNKNLQKLSNNQNSMSKRIFLS